MKPRPYLAGLASLASIAATVTLSVSQTAHAQATWTGGTDQDWNNAANWSTSPSNPTGNFTINTAVGNYPILGANSAFTPVDVFVGTASQTGRLDHTAGSLATNVVGANGNWFFVGNNGGTGTYNIADTSASGGSLTSFGQGSGSLTTGKLWVGGSFNTTGTGTVNINTSGTINAQSTQTYSNHGGVSLIVGTGGGTGTLNIDNGTINAAGMVDVASAFSATQATQGTLNIGAGGTLNSEGNFRTAYAGSASAQANVTLSGGTLNVGTGTKRQVQLGHFDNGSSTVTVESGNLNLNANTDIKFKTAGGGGTHIMNLNGGAITSYSDNQTTADGAGVVDLRSVSSTATTTFNLNGGTLTIREVITTNNDGTATFNFNGGTLRATGDTVNFVNLGGASQSANILGGGATIDSNGHDVAIPQALVSSGSDGGLTKAGDGSLTLAGTNTYTGATTVSAGSLFVNGSLGASAVTVEAGATVGGTGALGGPLDFDANAFLHVVDLENPLAVASTITFGSGFGIANLTGIDWASLDLNTSYEIISTSQVFSASDIENFGVENAADVGGGRSAYFENGSLSIVVIPEPSVALLGGLGLLALLRRRRC